VRDPQVFGGGAQAHPGPPGQPVRTGADAVTGPSVALVELGQQLQEPALGGGDVTGQTEQLGFQVVEGHGLQRGGQ
jgi:hypothetical protein